MDIMLGYGWKPAVRMKLSKVKSKFMAVLLG